MNPRPFLAATIAALMLALPAFAQDYSQMSDETLLREQERLLSFRHSNDPGKGYDERITSSDYEVEFQMQQMDKAREREHQARYNMIEDELGRRGHARFKAAQAREFEEREAESQAHREATEAYFTEQYRQLAEQYARLQQERPASIARMQALSERRQQAADKQVEDFYNRARSNTGKPWYVPAQPPTTSEPLFPVPQSNSNSGYFSDWPE